MKKRTKVYLALLITLLHLGSLVLSVQETQARNVYTMNWNTVMEPGSQLVTSECLVGKNDPDLTVLVGNMSVQETSHTITFPMEATTAIYGTLTWSTDQADLLEVTAAVGENLLTADNPAVVLTAGENTVTLTLTPTQEAKKEVKDIQPAQITVTWTDTANTVLTGAFQIMLENTPVVQETEPAEQEETSPTEETQPQETQPEEVPQTETEPAEETEPSEPEVTEATEPEQTTEATEPVEPLQETEATEETTQATEEVTEPSVNIEENSAKTDAALSVQETTVPAEETQPTETTLPEEDPAVISETEPTTVPTTEAATEPTTVPTTEPETEPTTVPTTEDATEPTTVPTTEVATEPTTVPTTEATEPTEEATEPTEPEATEPEEEEPEGFHISSVTNFNQSKTCIPVLITLEEGIDRVKLGLTPSSEGLIQPLPKNTRFSVNDGESFYMMYDEKGYVAEFSIPEGIPALPVLLDFSQVKASLSSITLTAQGFAGQSSRQSGTVTVYANADTQVTAQRTALSEDGEVPQEAWDTLFLTTDTELTFTLPDSWDDAMLDYSIEMLTVDELGRVEYTPANTEDGSLIVTYAVQDGEEILTLRLGSTLPPAGTYRANFQWNHEGITFAREQVTFFINYSAYMQQQVSGQEVQSNE